MHLRDFVKKRVELGDTQIEIASKGGISQGTVYKLLHTETEPTLDTIVKVAKGYGLPLSQFVADGGIEEYKAAPEILDDMDQKLIQVVQGFTREEKKRILEDLEDKLLVKEVKKSREGGSQ